MLPPSLNVLLEWYHAFEKDWYKSCEAVPTLGDFMEYLESELDEVTV